MKYVFVGSWKNPKPGTVSYTPASINQAENILISLIDVLQKDKFSMGSLQLFQKELQTLRSQIQPLNQKMYLDSGGYSIIVGDVKGGDVRSFIDNYHTCQTLYAKDYDYIFSLDIPIFLNEPTFNTKQSIKSFNKFSMESTKYYLTKYPHLRDKLLFVWQFKIKDQYDIWSELYEELELNKIIKYRALGGMVGLRGITQINFSPFIGPMYRCLLDYISVGDFSYPFKLHNLGIYIQHDRFFLVLLEKLFNRYLKSLYNRDGTDITYDSVNYMRTAQLRAKELNIMSFHSGSKIDIYKHLETPDFILQSIYNTPALFQMVKSELQRCKKGVNLNNIDAFTPLNVYSNVQLDKFFAYLIDRYNLTIHCQKKNGWNPILDQLLTSFPNVFTPRRIACLRENFEHLYKFHCWFRDSLKDSIQDRYKSLHPLMIDFIAAINFPAHFEEVYTHQVVTLHDRNGGTGGSDEQT